MTAVRRLTLAEIGERMKGQTGSVTLHYSSGALQKLEYRIFEKAPQEMAVAK